jgi:hypothetical protein
MRHTRFRRSLAFALIVAFASAAHAEDNGHGTVAATPVSAVAMSRALAPVLDEPPAGRTLHASAMERRPPQAAPEDPSKDPSAPPDVRRIRRALSGILGGLIGLEAGQLMTRVTKSEIPAGFGIFVGIGVGTWLGGR